MYRKLFLPMVLVIAALSFLSCSQSQRIYNEGINIIPTPVEMELAEGEGFVLDKSTVVVADGDLQREVAAFFAEKVSKSIGYKLKTVSEVPAGNYILLDLNPQMEIKDEGYTLEVNSQFVVVSAKDRSGLFMEWLH
jgi:hexosaminidase